VVSSLTWIPAGCAKSRSEDVPPIDSRSVVIAALPRVLSAGCNGGCAHGPPSQSHYHSLNRLDHVIEDCDFHQGQVHSNRRREHERSYGVSARVAPPSRRGDPRRNHRVVGMHRSAGRSALLGRFARPGLPARGLRRVGRIAPARCGALRRCDRDSDGSGWIGDMEAYEVGIRPRRGAVRNRDRIGRPGSLRSLAHFVHFHSRCGGPRRSTATPRALPGRASGWRPAPR